MAASTDDLSKYLPMLEEMYQEWDKQRRQNEHLTALWPHIKDTWNPENPIPIDRLMKMPIPTAPAPTPTRRR